MASTSDLELQLIRVIESRSAEINTLTAECKTKQPKLAQQRLPRYMRRRAASHNPKRVPKSVRITKKTNDTNQKKKKKKYKNRAKIEESVERRASKPDRTTLHIWFVKRFKMEMRWNYKMPIFNCTKNYRNLHRCAKNRVIYFYLPFQRCIEIDYLASTKRHVLWLLSHFTRKESDFDGDDDHQGSTFIYLSNSYPFSMIGTVDFLWNSKQSKLWLFSHLSVYDYFFEKLVNFNKNPEIKLKRIESLERFRLVGPATVKTLSEFFKFDLEQAQKQEEENLTQNLTLILKLNENSKSWDLQNTEQSYLWNLNKAENETKEIIITCNTKRCNNRICYDLILLSSCCKSLWYKLVQNRAHLVGGGRDLKSLCLNTSSLLFPDVGFADVKESQSYDKIQEIIQLKNQQSFYVLRDDLIGELTQNLSSVSVQRIINSSKTTPKAFVNVQLMCLNRGTPNHFDYIFIPTEDDIIKFIKNRSVINEEVFYGPKQPNNAMDFKNTSREVTGMIEVGDYSLDAGKGKALGVISLTGLLKLTQISESVGANQQIVFALTRPLKESTYRFVTVKVVDLIFS